VSFCVTSLRLDSRLTHDWETSLPGRSYSTGTIPFPLERFIRMSRQRLRPMGCFHDDAAIERAVFGQLLRRHKTKVIRIRRNSYAVCVILNET
jgi:hypothetical protein